MNDASTMRNSARFSASSASTSRNQKRGSARERDDGGGIVPNTFLESSGNLILETEQKNIYDMRRLSARDFVGEATPINRGQLIDLYAVEELNERRRYLSNPFKRAKATISRRRDSLDDLEFDERENVGFRYPLLERLDPKSLKEFKRELEMAEEMRIELNSSRDASQQILQPEPRMLIKKRHWALIFPELQQVNPAIDHFLDATFGDIEQWLKRATVPAPNNRNFIKRLNNKLSEAWSQSYSYGLAQIQQCLPFVGTADHPMSTYRTEEGDEFPQWDMVEDVKKKGDVDSKKLSTTSSVTFFSSRSMRGSLPEVRESVEDLSLDLGMSRRKISSMRPSISDSVGHDDSWRMTSKSSFETSHFGEEGSRD